MTSRKTFAPDGSASGGMTRAERRHQARKERKTAPRRKSPIAHLDARQRALASEAVEEAGQNIQTGRYQDGLNLLEDVLKLAPGHPEALAQKANLAFVHGHYDEAINLFRESIANEDRAANVHFNLGAVLVKTCRFEEAIEPLRRAVKLLPNLVQAHNALGAAYVGLWQFEKAKPSLKKALALPGPKAPAYTNLGIAHLGLGEAVQALASLTEALRQKSDPMQLYSGVASIAALLVFSDRPEDHAAWNKVKENLRKAMPGAPATALLEYIFESLKVEPAPDALARAQAAFPPVSEEAVALSAPPVAKSTGANVGLPHRVCALLHFGRSATGLLHTLVDGHPQVTTLPGIYFKGFFGFGVWDQIRDRDPEIMVNRFIDLYEVFFDARHPKPVPGNPSQEAVGMGNQEGFCNMGPNKDQVLTLNKSAFRAHMLELLASRESLTQGEFFLMLHRASERTQGKSGDEDLAFYHIHNPVAHEFVNYLRHFPDTKIVMNAREPIQNCESWITPDIMEKPDYQSMTTKISHMPFHTNRPEFRGRDVFGVKLDDLKLRPEATMRALVARLGIDWNSSLLKPTMQGLEHWGDPGSRSFGLDPFDPGVLKRKVGKIFSERDQTLLRTLYYPFRVLYDWEEKADGVLESLLSDARGLLDRPMDCEKLLVETAGFPGNRLEQHISYKYMRLALGSRLKTLEKYGTYPGMIPPLDVVN